MHQATRALPSTLFALLGLTSSAATLHAQEWPGFRGPARNGVAAADAKPPVEWSAEQNLRWKLELPGAGASSPIVVGDRLFVVCYSGYGDYLDDGGSPEKLEQQLVCVSREDGKLLWKRSVKSPLEKEAPQVQIKEHGFATPTPVSDGKWVWVYFGKAGVAAFDLEGAMQWKTDLGSVPEDAPKPTNSVERGGKTLTLRWGSAGSPLLFENLVIVNASEESNSIRALDKKTGALVWKHESANLEGCATSPMLAGKKGEEVLVIMLGGEVWGMEPATGEMLWTVETGTRGGISPTPVADAKLVYSFGGGGESHAIHFARDYPAGEERVLWKSKNLGIPSPVLHEGKLILVETNGRVSVLQKKDGELLYDERLDGKTSSIYASPVLACGRLYVTSRKRGTFVYTADGKFELLARNELDDETQFNASPAIVGDTLYLRSDRYLYCIRES